MYLALVCLMRLVLQRESGAAAPAPTGPGGLALDHALHVERRLRPAGRAALGGTCS